MIHRSSPIVHLFVLLVTASTYLSKTHHNQAQQIDITQDIEFQGESQFSYSNTTSRRIMAYHVRQDDAHIPVGEIRFWTIKKPTTTKVGLYELKLLRVDAIYKHQGIGSALFTQMKEIIKQEGGGIVEFTATPLGLDSTERQLEVLPRLVGFYERLGAHTVASNSNNSVCSNMSITISGAKSNEHSST